MGCHCAAQRKDLRLTNSGLTRSTLTVAGLSLSFLDRPGDVDKAAILFLHGLIAEAEVFRKLIAELPADRRIVALDLPGAGYSERALTADVSFAGMAAIVTEVIGTLGLHRPIVLGHSHGGAIALQLAVSHPEAVGALILLCPAHPFSKHEDKLVRFYLTGIGRRFAGLLPRLPRQLHLFALRRMPGSRSSLGYAELEPYLHTLRGPGTVTHLLRLLECWHQDMQRLGAALEMEPPQAQVLILWGDRDIVVPAASATRLLEHLPNAHLGTLRGIGHLPNEEAPEECATAISTWLEGLGWHDPLDTSDKIEGDAKVPGR